MAIVFKTANFLIRKHLVKSESFERPPVICRLGWALKSADDVQGGISKAALLHQQLVLVWAVPHHELIHVHLTPGLSVERHDQLIRSVQQLQDIDAATE